MPTTPAAVAGTAPHHWQQGPADVHPVKPFTLAGRRYAWKFYWCLDTVTGTSRSKAASRVSTVLNHPQGWWRAGVKWTRTYDKTKADILVQVIPQDTSVCGPGSAGCYSWGGGGKPVAAVGVEHIDDAGAWAELVNMELCGHGTFRMLDMYNPVHQQTPYVGVMGTWGDAAKSGYYPADIEIESAKLWLQGLAPNIHDD